jgi:pyruvate dehydrogenase E2 component (dihydrolipoamide acetyltransferase)
VTKQIEIKVPDIGDFSDIPVIEVLVAAGDVVDAEQSLLTLESDKATMEVPTPVAGTVKQVRVLLGDTVSEGDLVVIVDVEAEKPEDKLASDTRPAPAAASAIPPRPQALSARPAPPSTGSRQSPPVHHRYQWVQAGPCQANHPMPARPFAVLPANWVLTLHGSTAAAVADE